MDIDLKYYGKYRLGLTNSEIREYLKLRADSKKIGQLYRKFSQITGVNTMAVTQEYNKAGQLIPISLMYRHDVERFADVLFEGKPTYFD